MTWRQQLSKELVKLNLNLKKAETLAKMRIRGRIEEIWGMAPDRLESTGW